VVGDMVRVDQTQSSEPEVAHCAGRGADIQGVPWGHEDNAELVAI
jgi:hypothetical protein